MKHDKISIWNIYFLIRTDSSKILYELLKNIFSGYIVKQKDGFNNVFLISKYYYNYEVQLTLDPENYRNTDLKIILPNSMSDETILISTMEIIDITMPIVPYVEKIEEWKLNKFV